MNDIDLFSTNYYQFITRIVLCMLLFSTAFSAKAVGNILVNRIPSWSGKLIHNVKNINTFICTMIKDRCNAFQLRQNVSVL